MEDFKVIRKKMIPYKETIRCDCCEVELKRELLVGLSFPPVYNYTCPKCGKKFTSHERYPKIEYIVDNLLFLYYNKYRSKE